MGFRDAAGMDIDLAASRAPRKEMGVGWATSGEPGTSIGWARSRSLQVGKRQLVTGLLQRRGQAGPDSRSPKVRQSGPDVCVHVC